MVVGGAGSEDRLRPRALIRGERHLARELSNVAFLLPCIAAVLAGVAGRIESWSKLGIGPHVLVWLSGSPG
jgi:hypothetical protein